MLSENSEAVTEVTEDTDGNKATGKVATATNVGGGELSYKDAVVRGRTEDLTLFDLLEKYFDSLLERLLAPDLFRSHNMNRIEHVL